MKKRIVSILLTLCMVLMLVPATAFAETPSERYSMTLNFKYGTLYGETGSYDLGSDYKAGDKYDISGELYDLTGYKPYKIVDCRSAEGDGVKGFITDHDIVLDVLYEVDGSLAVTLDGFEVGKTPNDITYSFESTIPGIEFSEDDILSDGWMQYIFDGDANDYCWEPMSTTKEFRADTQYKLLIDLDNKGLELAPAVTVNGRTPKSCKIATSNGVPIQLQIDCDLGTPAEHSQYTITYDGGEDSDPVTDVKTHGEDLPLRGETFTMDGFVQTGWVDKETGAIYDLGATYDEDRDVTLYPVFEKLVTVTAPFTTTVALGDAGEPGETTFMLYLIDGTGNKLTYDDQYFFAEITTDGAGSYSGTMTITATKEWLRDMLYEGAFIWQYDGEEDGWTYDDTVWGVRLYMPEVAARAVDEASYELLLYPTYVMSDGSFNLDLNAGPVEEMTFTNTYTAHAYALKHDATHHWDECACKDVQNKELHKYGDWKVTKEATQTAKGEKEHTCTICGYTETAEIAKLPATTEPTNPDTDTKPGTKPGKDNPATGDNSHMALWIALLLVSGAGVIGTTVYSRKKEQNKLI
ncbi:sortase B protein-sorting domain-containing protein [Fournierella massiliensis]|nr:sortase B protein-sorting domain-containing protein [Fournierella massiliensis]MCF2556744.1 sortase B protein-sorting domain-containing protein [Fournierella massiliensis]